MDGHRRITMRYDDGTVTATNARGATLSIDPDGTEGFTPVELLLAALGSCGAVDVAELMLKQRDPVTAMDLTIEGEKDDHRMTWLRVGYRVDGDHDARKLHRALHLTGETLCTVSRTIRGSAPVTHELDP